MASNLSPDVRRELQMNGIGVAETTGDSHFIDLFLHLDKKNDKIAGDRFMQFRVGDPRNFPKNLTKAEADGLNRKIRQIGVFPWLPGEECLKHTFVPSWQVKNDRGETVRVNGEPQMGCKPCQVREAAGLSGLTAGTTDAGESSSDASSPIVSEEPSKTTAEVVQPETVMKCEVCDWSVKMTRKTGKGEKPSTMKQRQNSMRLHMKKHQ